MGGRSHLSLMFEKEWTHSKGSVKQGDDQAVRFPASHARAHAWTEKQAGATTPAARAGARPHRRGKPAWGRAGRHWSASWRTGGSGLRTGRVVLRPSAGQGNG